MIKQTQHRIKAIKFIADVNIEKAIIDYLRQNKYDVKWIPDYDCRILDEELLNLANTEGRILITNDKDFGELTFLQKKISTGIVLIRIRGQKVQDKIKLLDKLLQKYIDKVLDHFVVITNNKIRFVPMEEIR